MGHSSSLADVLLLIPLPSAGTSFSITWTGRPTGEQTVKLAEDIPVVYQCLPVQRRPRRPSSSSGESAV